MVITYAIFPVKCYTAGESPIWEGGGRGIDFVLYESCPQLAEAAASCHSYLLKPVRGNGSYAEQQPWVTLHRRFKKLFCQRDGAVLLMHAYRMKRATVSGKTVHGDPLIRAPTTLVAT